jgi:hypothetical protein
MMADLALVPLRPVKLRTAREIMPKYAETYFHG